MKKLNQTVTPKKSKRSIDSKVITNVQNTNKIYLSYPVLRIYFVLFFK